MDPTSEAFRIVHTTRFHFERPVEGCSGLVRLEPNDPGWCVDFAQTLVRPLPDRLEDVRDAWGNPAKRFAVTGSLQQLEISGIHLISRREAPLAAAPPHGLASGWLDPSPAAPSSDAVRRFWTPESPAAREPATIEDLMRTIGRRIRFDPTTTHAASSADDLLRLGSGVCHDFAHLAIAALRQHGIPAFFVWGYRLPAAADAKPSQRVASHAWVGVELGSEGWRHFDPTHGNWVDDRYVAVARGRDLGDVQAIEGRLGGHEHQRSNVDIYIEGVPAVNVR